MAFKRNITLFIISTLLLSLAGCSFNPFRTDNNMTGSAAGAVAGAGVGVGIGALAHASGPEIALGGIIGGSIGYYVTTLRFASGGVMHAGGQVFTLGDYVTIEIPSSSLFDVNTSDFAPGSGPILDSVVAVLNRTPNNDIMISGNTSGFYNSKFEHKLSEDRARQISAYLWAHGINNFKNPGIDSSRKLTYVGYGNFVPIANNITAEGVHQNDRIQITSYPCGNLRGDKRHSVFHNIGDINEPPIETTTKTDTSNQFSSADMLPDSETAEPASAIKDEMSDSYN